jgi:hypothetical protein
VKLDAKTAQATVTIKTTTKGQFTLSVRYVGLSPNNTENTAPIVRTYPRSGSNSYTVVSTFDVPCDWPDFSIKVTASARGKTSGARTVNGPFC